MLKHKAIEMRKEGYTYKEIADCLGVKESWCKYHLKGVNNGADNYIEDMRKIGVPVGDKVVLTKWVAKGVIFKSFPNVTYNRSLYLLTKAKNAGVIVVPDSTNLNAPTASYTELVSSALDLRYRLEEIVENYMNNLTKGEHPLPNRKAVQEDIITLAIGGKRESTINKVFREEELLIEIEELRELDFI